MTTVVIWGNCQAAPIADLLRAPLAAHGIDVARVRPVYLVSATELGAVHRTVAASDLLISQPVSETYALPGCGTRGFGGLHQHRL